MPPVLRSARAGGGAVGAVGSSVTSSRPDRGCQLRSLASRRASLRLAAILRWRRPGTAPGSGASARHACGAAVSRSPARHRPRLARLWLARLRLAARPLLSTPRRCACPCAASICSASAAFRPGAERVRCRARRARRSAPRGPCADGHRGGAGAVSPLRARLARPPAPVGARSSVPASPLSCAYLFFLHRAGRPVPGRGRRPRPRALLPRPPGP